MQRRTKRNTCKAVTLETLHQDIVGFLAEAVTSASDWPASDDVSVAVDTPYGEADDGVIVVISLRNSARLEDVDDAVSSVECAHNLGDGCKTFRQLVTGDTCEKIMYVNVLNVGATAAPTLAPATLAPTATTTEAPTQAPTAAPRAPSPAPPDAPFCYLCHLEAHIKRTCQELARDLGDNYSVALGDKLASSIAEEELND